ncbi:MAG: HD domain-containing protein [Caldilineaceae bacterium]
MQSWRVAPEQPVFFEHRWEHVQEVVKLAAWLAAQIEHDDKADKAVDREVLMAAAWLHDIAKMQPNHAETGAIEAAQLLRQTDFPPAKVEPVATAIRQHEGLFRVEGADPLEPIEAAILWDADKLSKLGIQALAYGLSAHYYIGKTLQARRKETQEWVHDVLSKTVYSMNTEPAKRLAVRRYREMVAALDAWAREETESIIKD